MKISCILFCLSVIGGFNHLLAQEKAVVEMPLYPRSAPAIKTSVSLLPNGTEIVDGNAAVVLLRMPYSEDPYVSALLKDLSEFEKMDLDDPRLTKLFRIYPFEKDIRRAARLRDANWEYPMQETPRGNISLADAPRVSQIFLGRGLHLRIGWQIKEKQYDEAFLNLQAQLACARHFGRTPFMAIKGREAIICKMALDRLEMWCSQDQTHNLYWALSRLPEPFMDLREAWDWDYDMIQYSLPSLTKPNWPGIGAEVWKDVAREYSELMVDQMGMPVPTEDAKRIQAKMLEQSEIDLVSKYAYDAAAIAKMSDEEKVMRWVLKEIESTNSDIVAYASMKPEHAIPRLLDIEQRIAQKKKQLGLPRFTYIEDHITLYLAPYHVDRWANQLQTLESIRHHLATHDNKLPATLADLELPAPLDPLTGLSFEYELKDDKAILRTPIFKGFEEQTKGLFREYVITVSK